VDGAMVADVELGALGSDQDDPGRWIDLESDPVASGWARSLAVLAST
jgi:hypothetical protein